MFDPSGPNTRQAKHQGAKRLERWLTSLPGAVALRSQSEHLVMSFAALEREANAMAVVLSTKYAPGTALVSDLQNVAQNVVLPWNPGTHSALSLGGAQLRTR